VGWALPVTIISSIGKSAKFFKALKGGYKVSNAVTGIMAEEATGTNTFSRGGPEGVHLVAVHDDGVIIDNTFIPPPTPTPTPSSGGP
jgi:hypothetical protein